MKMDPRRSAGRWMIAVRHTGCIKLCSNTFRRTGSLSPLRAATVSRRFNVCLTERTSVSIWSGLIPSNLTGATKPSRSHEYLTGGTSPRSTWLFIDDSQLEIESLLAAFPTLQCATFPAGDDEAIYQLVQSTYRRFQLGEKTLEELFPNGQHSHRERLQEANAKRHRYSG